MMRLTRWNNETAPSLEALRAALTGEGFQISEWADPPGTVYPVHTHDYLEVRWVVRGQLRVGLPESGEEFTLGAGDRLEVPANAPHWVDVDPLSPVVYLTGTKSRNGHRRP
jgi:quercetin dioxygenase-like cupin family protein